MIARDWNNAEEKDVEWLLSLHNLSIISLGGFWPLMLLAWAMSLVLSGSAML